MFTDKFKDSHFVVKGTDGFRPCLVYGDGEANRGVSEANARLIAASPDLKKHLRIALSWMVNYKKYNQVGDDGPLARDIAQIEQLLANL